MVDYFIRNIIVTDNAGIDPSQYGATIGRIDDNET